MKKLISLVILIFAIGLKAPVELKVCNLINDYKLDNDIILLYYWDYSEYFTC